MLCRPFPWLTVLCSLAFCVNARAADGVAWVQELVATMEIPTLSALGMTVEDFPAAIEKTAASSSMRGNPIALTRPEMEEILTLSL